MKKFTLGSSKEEILKMISEKTIKKVVVGEKRIALVRIGLDFYAFQQFCPHRGASLIEGIITASNEIICPLHHYRFDIKSGSVKAGSCLDLEIYMTSLTDHGLEISIP